jgi:polyribonucleotide 5'-hydroxyl-kinase
MRQKAAASQGEFESPNIGPRVVVVGPPGSGRSTIAMTLLNYAARTTPMTYVDLDVSHNDISLAGMLSAIVIERPVVPTRGWGSSPALAYPFGSPDLSANGKLYQVQLVQLLKSLEARDDVFPDSKHNGWIIKAPTWRSPESYDLVLESVRSVNPHVIITVGYDRLVHDLKETLQERISTGKTQIVNLARSGGVIYQGEVQNQMAKQIQIRDYFYGPSRELGPARITLPISDKFIVVKLKLQDTISITAMPIDHQDEPMEAELEVFPITVDRTLRHSLLAVSFAQSIEQVMFSNVAGYLHVLDVDLEKKKFTCTSPLERIEIGAPGPIYLIQTDFKFTDVE